MSIFTCLVKNRDSKNTFKKIFEFFHLKTFVFNTLTRLNQEIAIERLKKIKINSSVLKSRGKYDGKKILFNLVRGMYSTPIFIEAGMAKTLQYRGHEVKMLVCGNALSMCTRDYTIQRPLNNWNCNFVSKYTMILKV